MLSPEIAIIWALVLIAVLYDSSFAILGGPLGPSFVIATIECEFFKTANIYLVTLFPPRVLEPLIKFIDAFLRNRDINSESLWVLATAQRLAVLFFLKKYDAYKSLECHVHNIIG